MEVGETECVVSWEEMQLEKKRFVLSSCMHALNLNLNAAQLSVDTIVRAQAYLQLRIEIGCKSRIQ